MATLQCGVLSGIALVCLMSVAATAGGPAAEDDDRRARAIYQQGEVDYAAGRYEQAAEQFAEAFELSQRPALLFNLANAYERMGDHARAASYLRRYLASDRARDVDAVRARIRRLEDVGEVRARIQRLEEVVALQQRAREEALAAGGLGGRAGDEAARRSRRGVTLAFAASGVAATTALGFALVSRSAGREAAAGCRELRQTLLCQREVQGALERERHYALLADLSLVAAVVSAGMGIHRLLGKDGATGVTRHARVGAVLVPAGLGVGVHGAF